MYISGRRSLFFPGSLSEEAIMICRYELFPNMARHANHDVSRRRRGQRLRNAG
jgi:hypothetical protein